MSTKRARWLGTAWLLGLCLLSLGLGLGTASSLTYHEAFVALGGREILASGSWWQPTIGGRPWLEKPPLPFQAVAAVGWVVGEVSPWAARLPSAFAATALVLGIAFLARRHYGGSVALLAGAAQATTFWSVYRGRLAEADILLACLIVWTLAAFDRLRDEDAAARGWRWAFFILLGLASWAKGIGFGAALIGAVVGAVLIWDRRSETWRRLFFPAGWAVAALLTLAWPLAMIREHGWGVGSLWLMHITDRVGPRVGHGHFAGEEPLGYLVEVLGQGLPWTPFAIAGAWRSLAALRRGESSAGDRLLWAWTVLPLLLVSLPGGRNAHYAIHAMPPWSIWAALALVRLGDRLEGRGWTPRQTRRLAIAWFTVFAAACGLGYWTLGPRFDHKGDEWAFYQRVGALIPAEEPLILLHDDWDRQPYPTPFGPIPHDLAVRLYHLDRPASFHYDGESVEARGAPASSIAVIGRERDIPLLAEVGDLEILARGPTTRWDRSFVLFRLRPIAAPSRGDAAISGGGRNRRS